MKNLNKVTSIEMANSDVMYVKRLLKEYKSKELFLVDTELRSTKTSDTLELSEIEILTFNRQTDKLKATEASGEVVVVDFSEEIVTWIYESNIDGVQAEVLDLEFFNKVVDQFNKYKDQWCKLSIVEDETLYIYDKEYEKGSALIALDDLHKIHLNKDGVLSLHLAKEDKEGNWTYTINKAGVEM